VQSQAGVVAVAPVRGNRSGLQRALGSRLSADAPLGQPAAPPHREGRSKDDDPPRSHHVVRRGEPRSGGSPPKFPSRGPWRPRRAASRTGTMQLIADCRVTPPPRHDERPLPWLKTSRTFANPDPSNRPSVSSQITDRGEAGSPRQAVRPATVLAVTRHGSVATGSMTRRLSIASRARSTRCFGAGCIRLLESSPRRPADRTDGRVVVGPSQWPRLPGVAGQARFVQGVHRGTSGPPPIPLAIVRLDQCRSTTRDSDPLRPPLYSASAAGPSHRSQEKKNRPVVESQALGHGYD
jgi:hypothetical protein